MSFNHGPASFGQEAAKGPQPRVVTLRIDEPLGYGMLIFEDPKHPVRSDFAHDHSLAKLTWRVGDGGRQMIRLVIHPLSNGDLTTEHVPTLIASLPCLDARGQPGIIYHPPNEELSGSVLTTALILAGPFPTLSVNEGILVHSTDLFDLIYSVYAT
jgi:hypothetical protein